MKINKHILDMSSVYSNLSHIETIAFLEELLIIRYELEDSLHNLREDTSEIEMRLLAIIEIEEQMLYVNKNIRVVEDALLCHESKITNRFSISGKIHSVCLN
jgi:hypothetical protein